MIVTVSLLIIFIGLVLMATDSMRKKRQFRKYYQEFLDREKARNNYENAIILSVLDKDVSKLGFPSDYAGIHALVKQPNDKLHFSYGQSPEIELINIEYMPEYQKVTKSKAQAQKNNSFYNTFLVDKDDPFHSNPSYSTQSVTTQNEITSAGILTFKDIKDERIFMITAALNKEIYISLKTDFLSLAELNKEN